MVSLRVGSLRNVLLEGLLEGEPSVGLTCTYGIGSLGGGGGCHTGAPARHRCGDELSGTLFVDDCTLEARKFAGREGGAEASGCERYDLRDAVDS